MSSDCSHAMNNVVEHPFLHCSATHPLAVALLELAHLGGLLHPEVDLVGVLTNHLQIIAQLLSVFPCFCLLLTKLPLA